MNGRCPGCKAVLARPAEEGGLLLLGRQFVLHADRLVYRCPRCKHEVVVPLAAGADRGGDSRLLLRKRPA